MNGCRIQSGKTYAHEFQKEEIDGSPRRGAARSKQAKHLSMTPRLLQAPLRAVVIVSAVMQVQAPKQQRVLCNSSPRKALARPRGSLDASGGREDQAAVAY